MGCYDGAEACKLVECYILNHLSSVMRKKLVELYCDDGLDIMKKMSGPEIEQKRKQMIKMFQNCGLKITIKTNLTSVNFLDIHLNLKDNTYQPYRKPNSDQYTSAKARTTLKTSSKTFQKR